MLDVVVRPEEPLVARSDTPSRVRFSRGGSAANMAVALAAHHEVMFVGVVGNDEPGEMFIRELEAAGVRAQVQVAEGATGVVVAVVDDEGQRAMMTDRGVNLLLCMESVEAALDRPFDHLHVSGYTILESATRDLASSALDMARTRGASTSVDACSAGPLVKLGASAFLRAAGGITMLFANEEESLLLSNSPDVAAAGVALAQAGDEVVITRGRHGAIVVRGDHVWAQPARDVEVVDTTGAGDAATGGYLSTRLSGLDCEGALMLAMESASNVVRGLGARG